MLLPSFPQTRVVQTKSIAFRARSHTLKASMETYRLFRTPALKRDFMSEIRSNLPFERDRNYSDGCLHWHNNTTADGPFFFIFFFSLWLKIIAQKLCNTCCKKKIIIIKWEQENMIWTTSGFCLHFFSSYEFSDIAYLLLNLFSNFRGVNTRCTWDLTESVRPRWHESGPAKGSLLSLFLH